MRYLVFLLLGSVISITVFLPKEAHGIAYTFVDSDYTSFFQDSGDIYASSSFEFHRYFDTDRTQGIGLLAQAEVDLTQDTGRVVGVNAAGIMNKQIGSALGQFGTYVTASGGFDDEWTFSRSCFGGCTDPWSIQVENFITGGIFVNNSRVPSSYLYTVSWGGDFSDVLSTTFNGDLGAGPTSRSWGAGGSFYEGEYEIMSGGGWIFTLSPNIYNFVLNPTVRLEAQAGISWPTLGANEAMTVGASSSFFNSVGFTFSLPDNVTFSSASGVRAAATVPAPIPEPSTLLLLGTGLAGLAAWHYRKDKT